MNSIFEVVTECKSTNGRRWIPAVAHTIRAVCIAYAMFFFCPMVQAQSYTYSGPVTVDAVANGWNGDVALVATVEPITTTCPNNDGYLTKDDDPARKIIHALATAALLSGKKVYITTDGTCVSGRPRLLALKVQQ
jgi:hypothetical protein